MSTDDILSKIKQGILPFLKYLLAAALGYFTAGCSLLGPGVGASVY